LIGGGAWTLSYFRQPLLATTPPAMSVAIAPLAGPQGDAEAAMFAEALSRELMTGLAHAHESYRGGARVVAGNAAAISSNRAIDTREWGRSLNARYVLEGDLLSGGDGRVVNLRLIDVASGGQIWSERENLRDADVSGSPSGNVRKLSERIRSALVTAETRRVAAQPLSNVGAMELVVRAWAVSSNDPSSAGTIEARKLVDQALHLDPNLVPALISRASLAQEEHELSPTSDVARFVREVDDLTRRAIDLDPTNAVAWDFRAAALGNMEQWDAALEANSRAINLDPRDPTFYLARATFITLMGRPAEALPLIDQALALDPEDLGAVFYVRCRTLLLLGQAEQAVANCAKALGLANDWIIHLTLAAAYANSGDIVKAELERDTVLRVVHGLTIAQMQRKRIPGRPEYQKLKEMYWYEGMRKAGFAEH
jgi:adenylate cyclase